MEAAHRGLPHVRPACRTGWPPAARGLDRTALSAASRTLARLAAALAGDDPHQAAGVWADDHIRLFTIAELW